ncbi:hypothetical protein RDWZM_009259 [Blomia tropicalis]|uniref:RING-type E3 ubiquitin transferase n=1 Tax=Blomia tropicalis TaxID=40697 RepID=A0A9Q0M609_BLOTA|nr:hypothetical protein RDWZM_009259 [Blomia tropicalis]
MLSIQSFLLPQSLFILCILTSTLVNADIAVLTPDNKSVELFIDYKITYTPSIPDSGIIGLLVRAKPNDACSKLEPPIDTKHNWFVLADRSSSYHIRCSNREKIQHAAQAGYRAIILYSPYENYFQSSMTYYNLDHSNTSIPAVLVSHEDGELLNNRYNSTSGYMIYITPDIPPNLSYYLLPFAIVIGVCLLLTISFMIFQLIRCVQERRKAQRHRLSKKYLKKLPLQKFNKGSYYETCAICLDDYVNGEKIRILPCNHAYHMKCIDPWLTKNRRVCPVCKAKVTLPGMPESSDSESDHDRNQRSSNHDDSNERTRLLPQSSRSSRSSRVRNLGRLLIDSRNDSMSPSTSIHGNYQSTANYGQPLDDHTFVGQPGPSTSAPVISELSSGQVSQSQRRKKHRRDRRSNRSNMQVVAAEIAPLMAPPQLSINCDSDIERTGRSATIESNDSGPINITIVDPSVTTTTTIITTKPSKRPSVDHIV